MIKEGQSQGDTLDIAILYGPLSYYLYGDTLGGLNYDLINEYSKEKNIPVKFWPIVNLNEALENLNKNKFDLLASLPLDSWVRDNFSVSESLFLDRMVLIQLNDDDYGIKIKSNLDLANDTIFIAKNSSAYNRLVNLSYEIGSPIFIKELDGLSEEYICIEVAKGIIPKAVVNEKIAASMKRQYEKLDYNNPISFTQFQIWAFQKDDTIKCNDINLWINSFKKTDKYKNLINRYSFSEDIK